VQCPGIGNKTGSGALSTSTDSYLKRSKKSGLQAMRPLFLTT
jgi:hypothetical protein